MSDNFGGISPAAANRPVVLGPTVKCLCAPFHLPAGAPYIPLQSILLHYSTTDLASEYLAKV